MRTAAVSSLERARAYVAVIPGAVSGAGGHDQTFAVACKLVEFGLSPDDTWPLLLGYNQRCQPRWNERELRHKMEDAFRHASPRMDFAPRASRLRFDHKYKAKIDPATAVENVLRGFRCDEVELTNPKINLRLRLLSNSKLLISLNGRGSRHAPSGVPESVPLKAYQCRSWSVRSRQA